MFALICKRSLLSIANKERRLWKSKAHLGLRHFYATKCSLAGAGDEPEHSFTVNYLLSSGFVTLKDAEAFSKRVHFETPERADSVLCLLKSLGLTGEQISRVIRLVPSLLTYDAEKTLSPKLEFLLSKEVSSSEVAMVVAKNPVILLMSLEKRLIPCYDFLKSMLLKDQRVFISLKRARLPSFMNLENLVFPNVSLMRETGLPEFSIAHLMYQSPFVLCERTEKLDGYIKKVTSMGFNPSKWTFAEALQMTCQLSELTWERKMDLYKSWGWSDEEILAAFRKNPRLLACSDSRISNAMDFLLNRMGLTSSAISRTPHVLRYSLEKRIIPRCSVVKILTLKGLIGEDDFAFSSILTIGAKQFLDKFVINYQEQVPRLMSIFKGEVDICREVFGL